MMLIPLKYLLDGAALETFGADINLAWFSVNLYTDLLEIGKPSSIGYVVSVADIMTRYRLFATNCALSAHTPPPGKLCSFYNVS